MMCASNVRQVLERLARQRVFDERGAPAPQRACAGDCMQHFSKRIFAK
jgi:hypothetical protein